MPPPKSWWYGPLELPHPHRFVSVVRWKCPTHTVRRASESAIDKSTSKVLDELLTEPAERFERRIQRAKKKEYSNRSAEDWTKHGCAHSGLVERLRATLPETVDRCDASELTEEEFRERFERKNAPALIAGLDRDWPARSQWTLERLLRDYGSERFKVGEDDDGYAVYVKMRHYLRYLLTTDDDSPL